MWYSFSNTRQSDGYMLSRDAAGERDSSLVRRMSGTSALVLTLFGELRVAVDGQPIGSGSPRRHNARRLLALLALAPGHRLEHGVVVETLWPERPPVQGAASLYQAIRLARLEIEPTLR